MTTDETRAAPPIFTLSPPQDSEGRELEEQRGMKGPRTQEAGKHIQEQDGGYNRVEGRT